MRLTIQVLLSFGMYAFIFYSYAGKSGGDMAIVIVNIMAGLLHILLVTVYFAFRKSKGLSAVILAIILSQIAELTIFAVWGYSINEFIKNFKY